jgi:tetratricopeptide (TPR) repeat protein
MKIKIITLLISLITSSLYSQYEITIDARVLDQVTNKPIEYVNVEFLKKNLRAVGNKEGFIILRYDTDFIHDDDLLQISSKGYKTITVRVAQLYKLLKNTNQIYLKPNQTIKTKEELSNNYIYGTITSHNIPLQSVSIKVKGTLNEVFTDLDGSFAIVGNIDDVLLISYLGMKSKEAIVYKKTGLKVELELDGELLNEVLLTGKAKKEETIDLGLGMEKSFDELGYSVNTLKAEEIKPQYIDLLSLLKGKFAGVQIANGGVLLRGNQSINNSALAIFDLDGQIFDINVNQRSPDIEVSNIESITILKSLAAVTKYGTIGRGGVIVIKTKTASGVNAEPKKPSALATGNDYIEEVQSIDVLNLKPDYLQTLQNAKTFEEAKQTYKTLKQTKDNLSVAFYLDAAEYFLKWDNSYAMDIFAYVEELAKDNAKALKTLAFNYEALNKHEEARLVYQRIAILRPTDAQSYRDLALIYNVTGYYNEAMRLYKQMLSNSIEGVDFSGLQQPIVDELMHLLAFHRSKVDYKDLPTDLLTAKFKQDLRIVFEWNDPNAEFELQFVNPQKKFFKWAHTKFDNRERMLDEIKKGYTTEAYIIDDAEAGEWLINIEAFNETPDINPNYLKYTIYKNYGLPNETKTVKVIQLENIKQKVTLDKFLYQ